MRRLLPLLLALSAPAAWADPPGARGWPARVCGAIAAASAETGIDPHFHARLLWQESRFRADAVSPAGAQGIAQFMPTTAAREGLANPFDPWAAIAASSAHLADLDRALGSLGMAAAGYNAGLERARDFLDRNRRLPRETRDYLMIVTGQSGDAWKAGASGPDLTLGPGAFRDACAAMARAARPGRLSPAAPPPPAFGVALAAGRSEAIADRLGRARARAHGLEEGRVAVHRVRMAGRGTAPRPLALIGFDTREEARALCRRIGAEGGWCRIVQP